MFGKRATKFFQIVPGILVEVRILVETEHQPWSSFSAITDVAATCFYLWCHIAQIECVFHGFLTPFMIACCSQVSSVKSAPFVVCTGCSVKNVHTVCVCVHTQISTQIYRLAISPFSSPLILFEITELPV